MSADMLPGAGPELDALVAGRVLGLEVFELGYYGMDDETQRMRDLDAWLDRVGVESVGLYYIDVPRDYVLDADDALFSAELEPAFQVVQKMRERGWRCVIEFLADDESPNAFVSFFRLGQTPQDGHTALQSLPLAICLAALKAVGAESRPPLPTGGDR